MNVQNNIRRASIADIDAILQVYDEARKYMKEQGNAEQWGDNYPDRSLVENDISLGHCYIYI